ncbi:MAG: EAL domain-containing protein [Pseudomonadota bacterium]
MIAPVKILLLILILFTHSTFADDVVIAVRAHSGEEQAVKSWMPTINYLQENIPQHNFSFLPVRSIKEMDQLFSRGKIDFAITQPVAYVDLERLYGATRILTLVKKGGLTQFGSVIFSKKWSKINTLQDIKDKTIAGVTKKGFGGWLIGYNELLKTGIDAYKDSKKVIFSGTHEGVVYDVLSGHADAGIVRTGIIERMLKQGQLLPDALQIINQQSIDKFSLLHSSTLYPEWAFAKAKQASPIIAADIVRYLLVMKPNNVAAVSANYHGWSVPLDYNPVHQLMQKLHVGSYSNYNHFNLLDFLNNNFKIVFIILFITVVILLLIAIHIFQKNKHLFELTQSLKKTQRILELTEERTFTTLKSIGDAIISTDLDSHITYINPIAEALIGWNNREAIGQPLISVFKIINESTRLTIENPVEKCLKEGLIVALENNSILITRDGKETAIEDSAAPIKNLNGEITGVVLVFHDVTEKKRINAQLQLFRQQIDQSKDAVYVIDYHSSRFLDVNTSACVMLGYSREELLEKSMIDISFFFNNKKKWLEVAALNKVQKKGKIIEDEHIHQDGRKLPVEVSSIYQANNGQEVFVSSVRDISERKLKEQQLKEKNKFIQTVIDGISDAVMVINKDYHISMMNLSAQRQMDKDIIQDINSPKCYEILHHQSTPCSGEHYPCPLQEVLKSNKPYSVIHQHFISADEVRQFELTASPLKDENGKIYAIIESAHDITKLLKIQLELKERSLALEHLAHHDELTQLPNRLLLSDRLNQKIKSALRNKTQVAILFIDLDNFKIINDSLGHAVGDIVLKETAQRLLLCVRDADTVARLGGDEFTIILDNIDDNDSVTEIAINIIQALQVEFDIEKHKLYLTTSIGISLYPDDAVSAEDLLRNADSAMYKAKDKGRNTYQYYTADMTQKAFEHILMESNLRHALEHNELTVYYQPQVNSKDNQIIGMEALVRWQHPELGIISPAQFIPLAEKTGLIIQLGEQVFDIASKQMSTWMKDYQLTGRMCINLSGKQFQQTQLVEILSDKLQINDCKAEWIELEITENYVMDDPEQAILTLQKFQNMGIEIAVDDFGTGYSSLSYLKRLPINKLKIDQSFVQDIMGDEDNQAIIKATIALAQNMNLSIIAEGVETKEQKDFLLENGCQLIQGYYYSRPVSGLEMTQLLISVDWMNL